MEWLRIIDEMISKYFNAASTYTWGQCHSFFDCWLSLFIGGGQMRDSIDVSRGNSTNNL